jgi:hypothetical protein
VKYTCPAAWKSSDAEIRSKEGSLLTLRVYDLVEADKQVRGRPSGHDPPAARGWTTYYYIKDGDPTRTETEVAGLPATEWNYKIRIRPKDPQSKVTYWVVKPRDAPVHHPRRLPSEGPRRRTGPPRRRRGMAVPSLIP